MRWKVRVDEESDRTVVQMLAMAERTDGLWYQDSWQMVRPFISNSVNCEIN
ncbi:MAG: hypothetical protein AAFY72_12740 [Cyanobacteria bacterium J06649_4]